MHVRHERHSTQLALGLQNERAMRACLGSVAADHDHEGNQVRHPQSADVRV